MPNRRTFVALAAGTVFPLAAAVRAQGARKTLRIGFLSPYSRGDNETFLTQVRPELEKLGWVDGRNIEVLEPRTTEGSNDGLPAAAAELVAQRPDVILVQTLPATRALMQATKSIPIVMVGVGNPVEFGIVTDYRKPGGNVTGSSYMANEYAAKLLQVLKEAAPQLRSVALFTNPSNEATTPFVRQMRANALALGMQVQVIEVRGKDDLEPAFAVIRGGSTQSILLPPEPLILSMRDAIAAFAQAHGLPLAVVGRTRFLPAAGLVAFGPAPEEYAQLAARYIDQILKGARPGDLAIEQTTRFNLAINLKTAKALGLTIPQSLLVRADELIR